MSDKKHKCELETHSIDDILKKYESPLFATLKQEWQKHIVASGVHPLCTKYFKSESTIHAEIKRQLDSKYPNIIHPLSKFRYV